MSVNTASSTAAAKGSAAAKPVVVPLTGDLLSKFKPARVFKDAVDSGVSQAEASGSNSSKAALQLTSIAFDDTGNHCVTAGEDDVFVTYDARKGKKTRTLYSKKYGIAHARFTHKPSTIIHASTKGDHALRYHSMHDNKYLSYFTGHTATVRSLQMNPVDDTFISAGEDGTVRLWDLRAPSCRGLVNDIGGTTIAAFDSSGVVFAVACSDIQTILLFAATSLDDAPFAHAPLIDIALEAVSSPPPRPIFTSIAFSNNGKYLLIGTASDVHYVLDAYELGILRRLEGHRGLGPRLSGEEVCWSADSRYVFSGSADGNTVVWDLSPPPGEAKLQLPPPRNRHGVPEAAPTLQPAVVLRPGEGDGQHAASRTVKFNPRYNMMAVGGEELSFWLPEQQAEAGDGW